MNVTPRTEPEAAVDPLLLDLHLCFDLQNTSRAFGDLYRKVLHDTGLTYPQYLVMVTLWEHHELSVKRMSQLLRLDSGTLSPLLKRMEAAGLVAKGRSRVDERSVLVRPTALGTALREKAKRVPDAIHAAAGLTARQAWSLQHSLRQLAASLDAFEPRTGRMTAEAAQRSLEEEPVSVNAELHALHNARQRQLPAEVSAVVQRATWELAESGQAERAVTVGAGAPSFALPSATGRTVALGELLLDGPVVLTFYRGEWCPYCNVALRSLQRHHDAITARGARLVAVSPQAPDRSASFAGRNGFAFDILSDPDSRTAARFGLAFDLPDDLRAAYADVETGFHLPGTARPRTLPIPATYVIDQDGTVRWAFVNADYTTRAEPADILRALDDLR